MRWIISRKNGTLQQLWQWLCHTSKSMWLLCQIISYLEADSYASAIRNAISLGGDADTMACMAGGIAVATKGMEMPKELACCVYNNGLDDNLRQILNVFNLYLKEHKRE